MARVRVWDPVVRITHWGLAALIAVDLVNEAGANPWHRWFGYAAGALIVVRLLWGIVGSPHARLAAIAKAAGQLGRYVRRSREATHDYVAHNPFGAWMAFTLWGITIFVIVTGVLLQVEAFWGDERVETLHASASYLLAAFIVVHAVGAIVTSARNRMNLVKAMITGHKTLSKS